MQKLGLIDQFFYGLEKNGMSPVIMGGAMILDPIDSPYPLDGKILADHLAARMEKIPLMRQKLVQDSLGLGSLRLVDDPDFNVRNHITRTTLKKPGGYKELTDCLGAFSAMPLDLDKPLWHYEVIDGLEGGRLAVATHLHHAILDGVGALKALGSLWDLEPQPPEQPQDNDWSVEETPTAFELLRGALRENAERMYIKAPKFLMKSGSPMLKMLIDNLETVLKKRQQNPAASGRVKVPPVHRTSINVTRLSSKRVISYIELPMAEVKALSRHYDCTINDLTILFNAYALEHYFESIGENIDFDLVAGMPINTRKAGDESAGNVLTAARLSMHNTIDSVEKRLGAIVADTSRIKQSAKPGRSAKRGIDNQALMGLFSPIVIDTLLYSAIRFNLPDKFTPVNVGITNVPGSPVPLFMAGARQVGIVPMAPALDTVGLTICVSSSDTHLVMGYHGCGEAIKDKEALVEGARWGFDALKTASEIGKKLVAKKKAPPVKTRQPKKLPERLPSGKPGRPNRRQAGAERYSAE